MPTNSMLIIRPDYRDYPYDITRYGASFFSQIINAASGAGLPVVDLYADNATRTNFETSLAVQDPMLVNIFGHGNYNIIAVQNDEILLQGCINDNILAGRVIYDLSCRAGRDLGTSAVSKGAASFLGYSEDFTLYIDERVPHGQELNDEVARGFFESHNAAPVSYIRGASLINSYYASQDKFNYWIEVWGNIDTLVAAELMWDRDHQVMKPAVGPRPAGIGPLIMAFALLLLIPMIKKLK